MDDLGIGQIEDVHTGVRAYISQKWGMKFYVIGAVLGVAGLFLIPRFGQFGLVAAFMWFGVGYAIAHRFVRREFMRQFAAKNGFSYADNGEFPPVGDLFGRGHSRSLDCVVSGSYAERPVRFFFYSYTVGSGKNQQTHAFTVAEMSFAGSVPDMIVDSRDDWYSDGDFFKHKKLETGTPFDKSFVLKVREDMEIEALEVLTPEIMEQIIEKGRGYSFEFVGDKLYVWKPGHVSKSQQLRDFLGLSKFLVDSLGYRLSRLHDDVDAIKQTFSK